MGEEDEVLATQKLLDTIRGEPEPGWGVSDSESATMVADAPTGSLMQESLVLTRPLRSRSFLPGRIKVGLDIGTKNVKMVRLKRSGRKFRLLQMGVAEVSAEGDTPEAQLEAQFEAARTLLRDVASRKDPVITCLCDPGIIIRQIALPNMPRKDLERAIPFEARKHIPYDPSRGTVRYQIMSAGQKDQVSQVLLVAVPNDALQRHQEILSRLNLEPYAVEVGPLVLANAYLMAPRDPTETIVILDLGASGTSIDIRREGGTFFYRHLPFSGDRLTRELITRMDVSPDAAERLKRGERLAGEPELSDVQEALRSVLDSLLMEIRRSLAYYDNITGRLGFSRLLLTGGGALLPGLMPLLEEKLQIAVEVLDPLEGVSWDDAHFPQGWVARTRTLWALAIGLASRP